MGLIRDLFPVSMKACDLKGLFVSIIIYVLVNFVGGFVIGLFAKLPIIGFVFGFIDWILGVYCAIGIIVAILRFFNLVK